MVERVFVTICVGLSSDYSPCNGYSIQKSPVHVAASKPRACCSSSAGADNDNVAEVRDGLVEEDEVAEGLVAGAS